MTGRRKWSTLELSLLAWAAKRRGKPVDTIKAYVGMRRVKMRRLCRLSGLRVREIGR